jgi:hypothetical protein
MLCFQVCRTRDNGHSEWTQNFWLLCTTVRALQILLVRDSFEHFPECEGSNAEITLSGNKTNSVAFSSQVNYTDRVTGAIGEASADFCGLRVLHDKSNEFLRYSRPGSLFFIRVTINYSHEAEWTPFHTHHSENIWELWESNPGPLDL